MSPVRAVRAASASLAAAPPAIASSSASRSRGSVVLWLHTAPAPARTAAHRAATAMLADAIDGAHRAGAVAAAHQRERHGLTATTVTSTSHSGRASADTTRPVNTG